MNPDQSASNPYEEIIRQSLQSGVDEENTPEMRQKYEARKEQLLNSLGKTREEILKAIKSLKEQMPGLRVVENVPRRDHYAVEYYFISASSMMCKAELYLWSNGEGGILNLHGSEGRAKAYAFGNVGEIRLEGNNKPPLENVSPARTIAAYVARNLGDSPKPTGV